MDSLVDILNLHGGKWQMTATTPLALGLTVPATLRGEGRATCSYTDCVQMCAASLCKSVKFAARWEANPAIL